MIQLNNATVSRKMWLERIIGAYHVQVLEKEGEKKGKTRKKTVLASCTD